MRDAIEISPYLLIVFSFSLRLFPSKVYALVKRGWQQQINFPAFFIIMSVYSLFLAIFYGTLFFQLGYTQSDVPLRWG